MRHAMVPVAVLVTVLVTGCTDGPPRPAAPAAGALADSITDFLARSSSDDVRAVLVVAEDRTVVEEYYGSNADEYRNVFSVTKSVLATLVGIAVDEGLLALDDPLRELLPTRAGAMSPEVAGTTLEQLLTMSGGFPDTSNPSAGDRVFSAPDWVAAALAGAVRPPGQEFAYSDPGAHLVAAALAAATGRTVLDYAREKLFGPLGVDTDPAAEPSFTPAGLAEYEAAGLAWPVDPQGVHTGFGHLKLRPRDMAALGSLYLHGGTVDGQQVVSADWVRQATSVHVPDTGTAVGYGYLWWVDEVDGAAAGMAVGYGGQLVAVLPDRELVVVVSSDVGDHATVDGSTLTYLLDRVIAPAFEP